MKFIVSILLLVISSCSPKLQTQAKTFTQYYYVLNSPLWEVYNGKGYGSYRVIPLSQGDTISAFRSKFKRYLLQEAEYKGYLIYVKNPDVLLVTSKSFKAKADHKIAYKPISIYSQAEKEESTSNSTPTTGATIQTGPRGGRYYINSNGNKTYIRKK